MAVQKSKGKAQFPFKNKSWGASAELERNLRVKKLEESIAQQKELHDKRMETAEAELKLSLLKVLTYEEKLKRDCNCD